MSSGSRDLWSALGPLQINPALRKAEALRCRQRAGGRLRGPVSESLTKAGLYLNAIGAGELR
jgi:hypothetical protein